jgi:tetratricopeptide (TPR) repeat protein
MIGIFSGALYTFYDTIFNFPTLIRLPMSKIFSRIVILSLCSYHFGCAASEINTTQEANQNAMVMVEEEISRDEMMHEARKQEEAKESNQKEEQASENPSDKKAKKKLTQEQKEANQFFTPETLVVNEVTKEEEQAKAIEQNEKNLDDQLKNEVEAILNKEADKLLKLPQEDETSIMDPADMKVKELPKAIKIANKPKPKKVAKKKVTKTVKKRSYTKSKYSNKPHKKYYKTSAPSEFGNQDYRKYYEEGVRHLDNGNYQSALKAFDQSIALNSKFSWNYYNKGFIDSKRHRYKSAVNNYSKAINRNPGYFWSHYNRGFSYMKLGRYQKAINDFAVALELKPDSSQAHYNIAYCYEELKKRK